MSTSFRDLTGLRFGRLTALRPVSESAHSGNLRWSCLCSCGRTVIVVNNNLANGHTKSCGCFATESKSLRSLTHGDCRLGKCAPEYSIWATMRARCRNPKNKQYRDYGGRGITVCSKWMNSYESFLADVGRRPSPQHSIDRINNDGNYEPGNVRWATWKEQAANRRKPRPKGIAQ